MIAIQWQSLASIQEADVADRRSSSPEPIGSI